MVALLSCLLSYLMTEHYRLNGASIAHLITILVYLQFWYSWRHQIREFNKDYHVVAVDMRGYGETDSPPKTTDYNIKTLCQDIVQLIPALGHSSTVLVAHDWGGAVAWAVAQTHPEVVEKLVIMNAPHPRAFRAVAGFSQMLKSWYMFLFQLPWWPEFLLARFDLAFLNDSLCGKKAGVRNKDAISSDDLEAYKYTFSQPDALTGPINYYRCIFDNVSLIKKTSNIEVSTLIIWGDDDQFLGSKMAEAHKSFVSDLTVRHLTNCSHWTQQDQPEQVNQLMGEFLQ